MSGGDTSFKTLKPVTVLNIFRYVAVWLRSQSPFEVRRRRFLAFGSHVRPYHATLIEGGIGRNSDFGVEVTSFRFVHHFQTVTINIELPTVVHAPKAAFLVAAQKHGCLAVWTKLVQKSNSAGGIAKSDQLLSHQLYPNRCAIRLR